MINLINTLMHQQHRLMIRRKQQRRERPLPKRYSAPLDFEAFFDRSVDLRLGGDAARGKEGGDEGLGRLGGECCFCGHCLDG